MGATVQLYAAGDSGDGSPVTTLLPEPAMTDSEGSFVLDSYSCPSANALLFLEVKGGRTQATSEVNPAFLEIRALGACFSLNPEHKVVVNELTTVATIWPLSRFIKSATDIGFESGNRAAFEEGLQASEDLMQYSSESSESSPMPPTRSEVLAKLNTLADLLATCSGSEGGAVGAVSGCGKFLSLTTVQNRPSPIDMVTAALNLAQNPTFNVEELFDLKSTSATFEPTLQRAPEDWSLVYVPAVYANPGLFQASETSLTDDADIMETISLSSLPNSAQLRQNEGRATTGGTQAQTNLRFLDSLGINTHLNYTDTGYANASFVAAEVEKLGVKHVRDGAVLIASPTDYSKAYSAYLHMGANGIRFESVSGSQTGNPYVLSYSALQIETALRRLTVSGSTYVEALEGINELDVSGDPAWANDWLANEASLLAANGVHLPIYSPSLAFSYNFPSNIPVQKANPLFPVYGNIHPYAGNAAPGVVFPQELTDVRSSFPALPIVATEAGYYDASAAKDYVSDAVQAKYIPRIFLENFRAGIYRTYVYELLDEISSWNPALQELKGPSSCIQCSYGMITAAGQEKPSYKSVQNLISILKHGATTTSPGFLRYSVMGGNDAIHQILLQKSATIFDLVLWQEIPSWEVRKNSPIANPNVTVTLNVDARSVEVYRPLLSTVPAQKSSDNGSIHLEVPDDAYIVEITVDPGRA